MKKSIVLMLLFASISFSACSSDSSQGTKTDVIYGSDVALVNKGLPVKTVSVVTAAGVRKFEMEVASNDADRRIGLMNRRSLDENRGMLFIFESQGFLSFWMKNTLIPLDMIFVDEGGGVCHIVRNAQPCRAVNDSDCAKYSSEYPARYVLEIGAGLAQKFGIAPGDRVSW